MICPNCKTNIPDDSKFCPDCGTPVVNIDELRAKAKEITVQFKKGYNFYVNDGTLPRFVYNLTAANCEKIVAMETEIINKHLLIENEELMEEQRKIKEANRHVEEQRIREIASSITIQYAKAYDYYVSIGVLPRFVHNLDIAKCQQIIAKKNDIIKKQNEMLCQEAQAIAQQQQKGCVTTALAIICSIIAVIAIFNLGVTGGLVVTVVVAIVGTVLEKIIENN